MIEQVIRGNGCVPHCTQLLCVKTVIGILNNNHQPEHTISYIMLRFLRILYYRRSPGSISRNSKLTNKHWPSMYTADRVSFLLAQLRARDKTDAACRKRRYFLGIATPKSSSPVAVGREALSELRSMDSSPAAQRPRHPVLQRLCRRASGVGLVVSIPRGGLRPCDHSAGPGLR